MPTIRDSRSVAGGATAFPFQGNQYEYLPFAASLEFAIIAAATGVVATVYSGSDILQQRSPVTIKTTPVVYPDDFLITDAAYAGERISVEVQNTTGAPIVVETLVKITPL